MILTQSAETLNTQAAPASAECPHCGAALQRAEPGADGRILCLNCGRRFSSGGPAGEAAAPRMAEPAPLAYGYLRALGVLALLGGLYIAGTDLLAFIQGISGGPWSSPFTWRHLFAGCQALLGGWVIALTAFSLGPLDGLLALLVWKRGRLNDPPRGPRGSALPYILPPAVVGSVSGFMLLIDGIRFGSLASVAGGVAAIAAGLLAGFGAENARLLLWRLAQWGARLRGEANPPRAFAVGAGMLAFVPLMLGLALWIASLIVPRYLPMEETQPHQEIAVVLLGGLAIAALVLVALLGHLSAAMRAWGPPEGRRAPRDVLAWMVQKLPLAYGLFGLVWIGSILVIEFRWLTITGMLDLSGRALIMAGLLLLLGSMGGALARWRRAQEDLLGVRADTAVLNGGAWWFGCGLLASGALAGSFYLFGHLTVFGAVWRGVTTGTSNGAMLVELCLGTSCIAIQDLFVSLWLLLLLRETRASMAVARAALAREDERAEARLQA